MPRGKTTSKTTKKIPDMDVEVLAPQPSRRLVVVPPLTYQEYPKTLEHPKGKDNRLPPVIVNDWNQEQEYIAKGYEPPGKADPFGFLTSRATEKTDDAIRLMNEKIDRLLGAAEKRLADSVREAIAEAIGQINDVLDAHHDSLRLLNHKFATLAARLDEAERRRLVEQEPPKRTGFFSRKRR